MIGWMTTSEDVRRASTLQNNFSKSLILPQKQTSSDMKKKILLISLSTLFCVALVLGGWYWYASTTTNPWNAATLGEIPTPMGYKRVEAPAGSYAEFLRALPLKPRGSKVNYYTGGRARYRILYGAAVDYPLLSNFEQCADVTLRLRAEYLWQQGRYSEIRFRNVNHQIEQYKGGKSRKAFENYLRRIFGICSTYSVKNETKPRAIEEVQPGDVLVYTSRGAGRLGHAVLVADVAKSASGKIAILCVEGNTPARDIHVIRNVKRLGSCWFFLDKNDDKISLTASSYEKDELRHY